ncbi:hypothetical protein WS48_29310 [Burkholderia sp. RF7-non_BP1]|nr:hypothetical protein WS48_29310 [Burkholderia sp. RF7-non_BP1]KUY91889.1 hypothetical protein WS49_27025 [Burkholderia sp. RF7-non_BP4]
MVDFYSLKDAGNLYTSANYSISAISSGFSFIEYRDVILRHSVEQSIQSPPIGNLKMLVCWKKVIGLSNFFRKAVLDIRHRQFAGGGCFFNNAFHEEVNDFLVRSRFAWAFEVVSGY